MEFTRLHQDYAKAFTANFGVYNDASGKVRANVPIGPILPPPCKGKLPFYTYTNFQVLQEEADKQTNQRMLGFR